MQYFWANPVSFRKSWRHFQPRCYCVHEELQELPQGKHVRLEATVLAPVQPGCVWWNLNFAYPANDVIDCNGMQLPRYIRYCLVHDTS